MDVGQNMIVLEFLLQLFQIVLEIRAAEMSVIVFVVAQLMNFVLEDMMKIFPMLKTMFDIVSSLLHEIIVVIGWTKMLSAHRLYVLRITNLKGYPLNVYQTSHAEMEGELVFAGVP